MLEIEPQNTPNQSFSFDINGISYEITLKTTETTIADISINGDIVIRGVRVMPYRPIIPYEYLARGGGNIFFITNDGESPDFSLFNINQSLVYLNAEEVDFLNAY